VAGSTPSTLVGGWEEVRPEEAVGRILCPVGRRSFIWARRFRRARAAYPGASSAEADGGDGRPSTPLFGLAPHGVYRALSVTGQAVRSYRTLSPLPLVGSRGGLLSAALSLALPRPGVTRHAARQESGPSSVPMEQRTPTSSSRAFNIRRSGAGVMGVGVESVEGVEGVIDDSVALSTVTIQRRTVIGNTENCCRSVMVSSWSGPSHP